MKQLVVYLWLAIALTGAAPLWATEHGTGDKTWKTVAEMSAAEKVEVDLRTDTPRDPKVPYLPAKKYPFASPYTAEEMAYRAMEFPHIARWSHALADSYGSLTSGGFLNQGVTTIGLNFYIPGNGVLGQIEQTAPGQDYYRMVFYYTFPPEQLGTQELWVLYRTDQHVTSKLDYFTYAPSLRRVRRQPQPRRGERFPNNVQSFDDITGRDAWEFSWRFLGTDVIYETVRFPTTRPSITLASPDGQFREVPTQQLKMMGDASPFYTADGGIECYVIAGVVRPDWLPNYSASKILYWLDRHYFYPVRIEQDDGEGRLRVVEVRMAKHENPALKDRGYAALITVYYDLFLDLMSYSIHDAHLVKEWSAEDRAVMFGPDFMRRGWLMYPLKTQSLVGLPAEFFLRPRLYEGKFPQERPVVPAADVAARIRAQEAAGHLVFDSAVAGGK
ncbi:MAG TPA: hypothetical protein VGX03_11320 [Candidatus Binatia bacterium]|jgi:hypothetical protein|nr:hypothetical protein [Candidatus Binatia bacterium]